MTDNFFDHLRKMLDDGFSSTVWADYGMMRSEVIATVQAEALISIAESLEKLARCTNKDDAISTFVENK